MQGLEGRMVDIVHVEVDRHDGAGRERRELVVELGDAGEGEGAADGDLPGAALLTLLHLDQRKPADGVEYRDGDADTYAGEQVDAGDAEHRGPVDADLLVHGELVDVMEIDEIDPDEDEQPRQHRERDALDHGPEEQHAEQDPDAMEDGRPAGGAAGVDVGRGTDDDAGDGKPAEQAGDEVSGALGREFLVQVGTLAAVQLVGGHGAEKRFHAGDDGEREHGDDEHAPLRRQFQLGKRELFRQVDPLDVHLRHEGEDGADDDGDQRSGDRPQAGPRQFLPEHQHADGHDAERRGRGTESA